MTMPYERMRAMRWAFESLKELANDELLARELRDRAAELASRYPSPAELLNALRAAQSPSLPEGWGEAITQAFTLFTDIRSQVCDASIKRKMLHVLRHHPDPRETATMLLSRDLQRWLAHESDQC